MATLDTIQDAVDSLTASTTSLLNEVNVNKSTLTNSATSAANSATNAAASASTATTQATNASNSATAAASSAATAASAAIGAEQIVLGVETNRPDIRPSLNLDFANVKALDPRITFARASTGTYYDGQTVAKAEENLLLRSQEFDNAVWSKPNLTITANSTTAPDGTTTAENIVPSTGSNAKQLFQAVAVSGGYRVSAFAKANGYNFVALGIGGASNSICWYDLQNGVVGTAQSGATDATITSLGDDWYRCSHFIANSTGGSNFSVFVSETDNVTTYTGNGTSGIFLWGAQLEQRSAVTAYTPTTTQPITNYIPVLQTASANVARFDHNPLTFESLGLLVEEQRTNLFTYSEDFSNAAWLPTATASQVTSNEIIAPNGTLTGDLFSCLSTSDVSRRLVNTPALSVSNATTYTASVYVKARNWTYIGVAINANTINYNNTAGYCTVNLDTGAISNVSSLIATSSTNVGNGWWRIAITGTTVTTTATLSISLLDSDEIAPSSAVGVVGNGVFLWGAQLEAGAFPTSYISTSASQVTRSADSASMTGANFSEWYRQDEGTLYAESVPGQMNAGYHAIASFADATASETNFISIGLNGASTGVNRGLVLVAGGIQADLNVGAYSAGTGNKQSLAYKFNDIAYAVNGATAVTDTSAILPTPIQLFLGQSAANNISRFSGTIKKTRLLSCLN
jgi:hypothetical protein